MSSMEGILLWNTLSSTADIENSRVGEDGENLKDSPAYAKVKFENGATIPKTQSVALKDIVFNKAKASALQLPAEGSLSYTIKPNGWSLTNTTTSDGAIHRLSFFGTVAPYSGIQVNAGGLNYNVFDGTNNRTETITDQTLGDGVENLISIAWSSASNLVRFYLNAVQIGSADGTLSITPGNQWLCIGNRYWSDSNAKGFGGEIENVKLYNTYETDFSNDLNHRGFGGGKKRR